MFSDRSRLVRQLAGLAAATAALVAAEVMEPLPVAAKPPHTPAPTSPKPPANWFKINWSQFIPKTIPKIHIPKLKLPSYMKPPKQGGMHPPRIPKQPVPVARPQPRARQIANAPNPAIVPVGLAPKKLPQMKRARDSLTDAWLHVNAAAPLSARKKTAALTSISQALIALGGATPKALEGVKDGNHVQEAEDHLLKAQKQVLESKTLPLVLKMAVLGEITKAQTELRTKAKPGGGKAAPAKR